MRSEPGQCFAKLQMPHPPAVAADKHGALAIHWAAGSGHLAAVVWLLGEAGMDAESEGGPLSKRFARQAKRRRPLHYAAVIAE